MSDQPSIAMQVMQIWGATVTQLPTSSKDECDLLAALDGVHLLVEEKTKLDDPRDTQAREASFARGDVHGSVLPLRHNNTISGIVRKATDQLSSTGSDVAHDLRVIWFTGVGYHAEAKQHQFISTIYGSTRVFELDRPQMRPCYFFRNSDFFRFRDHLDGAIAAFLTGDTLTMKLCLNPYSQGWERLRDSPFSQHFKVGLVDPIAEEHAGEAYVVDSDMSRSNEYEVLRFLEKKYGLEKAQNMDMHLASAAVRVPS